MISYKKQRGFSLVEAMMAMLVIGLVFVMVAPFVLKKVSNERAGKLSKGFYFQHSLGDKDRCFVTKTVTSSGLNDTITIEHSDSCQEYTFVVPSNVHAVDLTLVAGGGGGGGASGGTVFENNLKYAEGETVSESVLVNLDTLKHIYIDYMIGKGQNGKSASTTTGKAGRGGYSGNAIVDYKMSRETVYDWLFKTPMEFFVKNNPEGGGDYNPVNKKSMTENYKRFYAKFGYVETGGDTYLDFLRYGNLGDTKRCQNSKVNDTDSCMSAKLIAKNGNSGDIFNCVTRTGLEDEDTTKCRSDISKTTSIIARQAPINSQTSYMGSDMSSSTANIYNSQFQGTQGGSVVQAGTCGVGGKGGYLSTSAKADGTFEIQREVGEEGSAGCGSVIVATEYAGQSGAGGVGGTAVTFKNFPVIPGSAYKIYVGKGGAGGASGISGFLSNNKNTEIAGNKGVGGASAAIYDEDDNLVVMVLGGVGGAGGNIKTVKKELLTNSPDPADILPNQINSTRQYPVIIVGSNYLDGSNNAKDIGSFEESLHTDKITIYVNSSDEAANQLSASFGRAFRMEYKYANTKTVKDAENNNIEQLVQSKEAVRLLNLNSSKIYSRNASSINFDSTADDDKRTGGFSNYVRLVNGVSGFDNNIYAASIKVQNSTYSNIYNGFYARYLDGIDYMYAGGLGGFSGLGTKAGCGGGFVGNKGGMTKNFAYNSIFENTFIIGRSNTESSNKLNVYKVSEYYDGCSLASPDGQSAEFIKPSVSSIDGEIVGQAGSGGGGGGWSTKYGAGKGGDGQDGYVFMTWKK